MNLCAILIPIDKKRINDLEWMLPYQSFILIPGQIPNSSLLILKLVQNSVIGSITPSSRQYHIPTQPIFLLISRHVLPVNHTLHRIFPIMNRKANKSHQIHSCKSSYNMEIFSCCRIESVLQKLSLNYNYPEIRRRTLHQLFVETEIHRYSVIWKYPVVINLIFLHLLINYQLIQLIPAKNKVGKKINIDDCLKQIQRQVSTQNRQVFKPPYNIYQTSYPKLQMQQSSETKQTKSEQKPKDNKNYKMSVNDKGKKVFVFQNFEQYPFEMEPEYELDNIKGWGTYSIVCSGKNTITNQLVAIKRIHKVFDDLGDTRRILREIKILKFLKHRNIVGLKDILKIQNKDTFEQVYLCMEYMEYTLKRLAQSQQTTLTQEMIQFILYQLLSGVFFMHSADIIHRDLKPDNILISKKLQLKIADMNLAKKEIINDQNTFYVTSRPYRAPEIFINPNNYTKAIDIWSIGCIFAQMLGKTVIFLGKDFVDQLRRFVAILGKPKLEIFSDLDPTTAQGLARVFKDIPDREKVDWKFLYPKASQKALDLLDHMLVYDPKQRYTAEECLNHPFLQTFKNRPRPKCNQIFDFSFDKQNLTVENLRQAIFEQVQSFQQKKMARPNSTTQESQPVEKKQKVE